MAPTDNAFADVEAMAVLMPPCPVTTQDVAEIEVVPALVVSLQAPALYAGHTSEPVGTRTAKLGSNASRPSMYAKVLTWQSQAPGVPFKRLVSANAEE